MAHKRFAGVYQHGEAILLILAEIGTHFNEHATRGGKTGEGM
nr:hypothetical protein [Candidatus Sigynarchaeum springense]